MKKKIILLGPYPPPYGGVSMFVSTLFELLRNRGVRLWAYGDTEIKAPGVQFVKYRRLGIIPLLIRDAGHSRIVDSSHFLLEYPSKILVPLWVMSKALLGFEWVKVIHDGSLPARYGGFGPLQRWLFRLAAKFVTNFIVVSEDLALWLRHEINVEQKVSIIKSLLPLPSHAADDVLPAEVEKLIAQYSKRVCSAGVFTPEYGFRQIADSLEKVRQELGENLCLVLLDGAFACDLDYRSDVLRQREWITVLKNVPHPQVLQIMKRSDLFVRGVCFESYGLSRVEAMWCGLPVVATRVGETRGMLLYDYGDEEELTRQIKRALTDSSGLEVEAWAATFRREAEENLRALMNAIDPEAGAGPELSSASDSAQAE
ncbi:MAG: glycosyltransferase family 4 protein [Pyrinomonadaceae bacterium]|nr:glycosyltransferase family 4 protein [Pyrinomonadaceae bacterium]